MPTAQPFTPADADRPRHAPATIPSTATAAAADPDAPLPPLSDAVPELLGAVPPAEVIGHKLDAVQREMNTLRAELSLLRRRDDTINQYMHRLDEELRLAARLQQDFLPRTMPQLGRLRFHALFRPAGYVSGDLYDVMRLDERHVGFYIADAVGHGMPAALLTMFLKHALVTKDIAPAGPGPAAGGAYRLLDPGESMRRLNQTLLAQNLSAATFATALYGVVDVETLACRIAKAGHPTPLLLRHGGQVEPLEVDGCLLGVFSDEAFETRAIQLQPGDRIVLYTDGIEVALADDRSLADGRPLDCSRWRDELVGRRHLQGEEFLEDFARHLDKESGSLTPRDDLTMMLVEVLT